MELGLFTCGYQRVGLERAFSDAAACGYDFIELWGGRPDAYAPDLLAGGGREIRRLTDKYAVPVRVYTPEHNAYPYNYMLGSAAQWADSIAYLSAAIHAGAGIGAEYTLLSVGHGGGAPYSVRWERLIKSLRALARAAEDAGHKLLLETLTPWESNTCTTLSELVRALDETDSPCLFGMCDLVAPFSQGEDPADYPRRLGPRMRHMHLVDADGRSDAHLIPGEGVLPLSEILRGMRAAGYDRTATIELVTNYIETPSESARLALERARKLL